MVDDMARGYAADEPPSPRESEECWQALPDVLRAAFECSRHVPVRDALTTLGVSAAANLEPIRGVYESARGPLVMTVWHDRIEREGDGSLACWIDAFGWRPAGEGPNADRNAETRGLLASHAGRDAYVLLLKRGWDATGAPVLERSALDIVMWRLAAAGQQWYVLRRPAVKRLEQQQPRGG